MINPAAFFSVASLGQARWAIDSLYENAERQRASRSLFSVALVDCRGLTLR